MSRTPKPWYRNQTGEWMVVVRGRRIRLAKAPNDGEGRRLAWKKFHELMASLPDKIGDPNPRIASLLEEFLDWSARNQSSETYRGCSFYLNEFDKSHGDLRIRDLRVHHVTQWAEKDTWVSSSTRYNAIRHVVRALNWAVEQQLIDKNPIKGMRRPKPGTRHRGLDRRELVMLARAAHPRFRALLIALRQTGARHIELRHLTWEQIHGDRLVIADHKTAGKVQQPRVIPLTPRMQRLIKRIRSRTESAFVFVNTRDKPWTCSAVNQQIRRLRKKLNLPDDVCAYMIRHTFATEGIANGVDVITLSKVMGHQNTTMLRKHYGHVEQFPEHMESAMRRAAGDGRRCT
ncbi:MAG: site-specific integrase [Planctomycetota bacterium]|nr:MAG: site-specific integrase [Planctomycetota bacterium]REK25943.1 MAG: site-specific integrase [Planctomycetota bacterium]REK46940.1 MAG: site-specific integrase [Planctomycetota bacterium]